MNEKETSVGDMPKQKRAGSDENFQNILGQTLTGTNRWENSNVVKSKSILDVRRQILPLTT